MSYVCFVSKFFFPSLPTENLYKVLKIHQHLISSMQPIELNSFFVTFDAE